MRRPRTVFPILKYKEIATCLQDLDIPLTIDELKNPTEEVMKTIYESFLDVLMSVTKEELRTPTFNALQQFSYRELHEDSIEKFGAVREFIKLLDKIGYSFSVRNVFQPDARTTKEALSALINYTKHRTDRMQICNQFTAQQDELNEIKQQLGDEQERLEAELANLNAQQEAQAPEVAELKEETQNLATEINELSKHHTAGLSEYRAGRDKLREMKDKMASSKFHTLTAQQECDKLRSQIVKSPERLKKSLADMNVSIEVDREEMNAANAKLLELKTKAQGLTKISKKLEKRTSAMRDLKTDFHKTKELHKQQKENLQKIHENEAVIGDYLASEQHMKKQLNAGQDKLFRLQSQFEHRRTHTAHALDVIQTEKLAVIRVNAKDRTEMAQNEALARQIEQEISKTTEIHEEEMQRLKDGYAQFEQEVAAYHSRLLQHMR